MKETFNELFAYLKNPILAKDPNKDNIYRLKKFSFLLIICLLTSLAISPAFILIEEMGLIDSKEHAIEDLMKTVSKPMLFFIVAIIAPTFEELIFRAPMTLFKNKKTFKVAFYTIAILFGLIHITNFTITKNVLLLLPILVAPQILLGFYLGFIRIRFGLGFSIALHACYNALLMLITFSADVL